MIDDGSQGKEAFFFFLPFFLFFSFLFHPLNYFTMKGETQEQIIYIYPFLSLKKAKLAAQMLISELCWHRLEEICDLMS